ncbi:hypothetical protein A4S05_34645 [Nostoc sp. KVJ20]|nr:hypothetical protein A4S05_34645 [Nostoc sp. KVJ20]
MQIETEFSCSAIPKQYLSGFGEKGKGKEKTFNLFPKPNSEFKMLIRAVLHPKEYEKQIN